MAKYYYSNITVVEKSLKNVSFISGHREFYGEMASFFDRTCFWLKSAVDLSKFWQIKTKTKWRQISKIPF